MLTCRLWYIKHAIVVSPHHYPSSCNNTNCLFLSQRFDEERVRLSRTVREPKKNEKLLFSAWLIVLRKRTVFDLPVCSIRLRYGAVPLGPYVDGWDVRAQSAIRAAVREGAVRCPPLASAHDGGTTDTVSHTRRLVSRHPVVMDRSVDGRIRHVKNLRGVLSISYIPFIPSRKVTWCVLAWAWSATHIHPDLDNDNL